MSNTIRYARHVASQCSALTVTAVAESVAALDDERERIRCCSEKCESARKTTQGRQPGKCELRSNTREVASSNE